MKKILLPFFCLFAYHAFFIPAAAQQTDTTMWGANGNVNAVFRSGNTLYLGGDFNYVGPNTGSGVILTGTDGTVTGTSPRQIAGSTFAAIPDGKGGWYLGGSFTGVEGEGRNGLAHLLPDGKLDPAWNPTLGNADGYGPASVWAMALSGNSLFIGGMFNAVNGQPRSNLAALDATTGQLQEWQPGNQTTGADALVRAIAVSGEAVYVGGDFGYLGGMYKPNFAVLDAVTGEFMNGMIIPSAYEASHVSAIAVVNNKVYIGGSFEELGSDVVHNLLVLNLDEDELHGWVPTFNGHVRTLAVSGNVLYAGGEFTVVDRRPRNGMAAMDLATNQVMEWNPPLSQPGLRAYTSALAVSGSTVYASGSFADQNGLRTEENVHAFDVVTGQPVAGWNLRTGRTVRTLAVAGNSVFVGGDFTLFGGEARKGLAAIDVLTGRPTPWNPVVDGIVMTMAVGKEEVYIGGHFTAAGGAPRRGLAAIDRVTGAATAWQADVNQNGNVNALALVGGNIFAGGSFGSVGEQSRRNLAVLDAETGKVLDWGPEADGAVFALAVSGSTVYAGGMFTSVGGQNRSNVAALDTITRRVTAWNPEADAPVRALAPAGNRVYAGGDFAIIGGQRRHRIAALDPVTGRATAWHPDDSSASGASYVTALAVYGNALYAGGYFATMGGANRNNVVALDLVTGRAMPWNADFTYCAPTMLSVQDDMLYAGGRDCIAVDNKPVAGLAALRIGTFTLNYLTGNIFEDGNGNCTRDDGEGAVANALVIAQPGSIFASTDPSGNYTLALDTGSYTISQVIPRDKVNFIRQVCPVNPGSHTVQFTGLGTTVSGKNFANQIDRRPILLINVSSDRRRRCFTATTTVSYCNGGFGAAANVKVHVKLPPHVVLVSANAKYTLDGDKNLVFDVNTLAAGACGIIQLVDSVVCNDPNIRGLTQCTRAWITPANARTPGPEWDGSDIILKARCGNNGRVRLGIYNTGTGLMTDSTAYRVYLDAQLAFTRNVKLGKGDSLVLQVPANGRTVRLEADQRPGHPTKQSTNVTLEACGTNAAGKVSLGFVDQLPGDDEEPEVAEQCLPIIDSFDPNDKAVRPGGVTERHYTPTRSRLDYLVRFQNTGTDVAYKVVVVDTLSEHLDVSTLQVGAVSHPYQVKVSGKGRPVLTFSFNNILLPDSNANEPKSHGYIQFSITPKANLPEKTQIENFADIFFDYNEPVRTNTTFNTLYDLPPVPAEAVRLASDVVCTTTNLTATAGSNRTVCGQDTVVLAALRPAGGDGRWQAIGGTAQVAEPASPTARVSGLAYGENVFEWRVAANSCGTDSLAGRLTITRLPRPVVPTITQRGADSLACSANATRYDWYFEGTPLGLHTRTIQASQPGRYTVRLTQEGDCYSEPSAAFSWLPTGTEPVGAGPLRVYPNPTTGAFVVVLPPDLGGPVQLSLHDAMGRVLAGRTLRAATRTEAEIRFELAAEPKGVYLLKVQTTQGVLVRKVCKQ